MSAPTRHMTAAQIQVRLGEIKAAEAAHSARDMDAELREVMRNGGDVDALESAQLDAERASRRFRVERAALESDLPLAIKREGEAELEAIRGKHLTLAGQAKLRADAVVEGWEAFSAALKDWEETQEAAVELTQMAYSLSSKSKAVMPTLGNFRSAKLVAVAQSAQWVSGRFQSADSDMQVGFGVQSHTID